MLRQVVEGRTVQSRLAKLGEGGFDCGAYRPGSVRARPEPVEMPEEGLF